MWVFLRLEKKLKRIKLKKNDILYFQGCNLFYAFKWQQFNEVMQLENAQIVLNHSCNFPYSISHNYLQSSIKQLYILIKSKSSKTLIPEPSLYLIRFQINLIPNMSVMCGKAEHFSSFHFCEDCAKKNLDISMVFCCSECHLTKRNYHRSHPGLMLVSKEEFTAPFLQIRNAVQKTIHQTRQKFAQSKKNVQEFGELMKEMQSEKHLAMLKLVDQKQSTATLLLDVNVAKWLVQVKFWQGRNRDTILKFEDQIKSKVSEKIKQHNDVIKQVIDFVIINPKRKDEEDEFKVQLPQNDISAIIEKQINELSLENAYRKKEADVCSLVIKLFTSFNCDDLWETERDCQNLLEKYPDSKVLYLCLIRINELLPDGHKEIPAILNNIILHVDKNFGASDIYHYYMAMSNWQLVQKEDKGYGCLWFELKNKRYYRLNKPDAYIASLMKAIAIKQKPAYYISLGIGYIAKENHQQALKVLKQASSMLTKRSDALDLNKFWAETKINDSLFEFQSIMQNLETRTLQFITNICKYFKKSKHYSQLVLCCEELIARQPQRYNFKIQFIKSILSYSSTVNEFNQDDHERLSRADSMIEDLKRAQEREASKLQKRLTRVRAQNEFKNHNLMKASEGFQALTKNTKLTSGSDYYNYAATQFQLFIESQCSDQTLIKQAYDAINKAIISKPKKIKYKKLKFFTCTYFNFFNQAYHTYQELKKLCPTEIDDKEYIRLIQFVNDNMEPETPMG